MQACIIDSEAISEDGELKELFGKFVKNPTDAGVCDQIGEYYLKNKKYDHAIAYLEKSLQLNPNLSSATTHLAMLKTIKETSFDKSFQIQEHKNTFGELHSYSVQQTILFVGEYFHPPIGGAEKSAMTLLGQLVRDGHRCIALCKGDGLENDYNGIHIVYLSNPGGIEPWILKIKPTLIITQITWAQYAISLAKRHHIPGILFVRSLEYFCMTPVEFTRCEKKCAQCTYHKFNRTIKSRYKVMIKSADKVICNSEFTKNVMMEFYGREAEVLYPAINLSEFQAQRTSGTFIVMNQPEYHKGGDLFNEIAEKMADQKFMTVGRGMNKSLSNCICYGQTDPHLFFQHAKLLLVPSLWPEPFGRIAVEAMYNGIPVIASNCGGLPEIIGDAGILIDDFHNSNEWEKKIRLVLEDEELYSDLSIRAKERSILFDYSVQLQRTRQIINDTVEIKKGSSDKRILDFYNKRYEKHATYTFLFSQRRERLEGLCNMVNRGEFYIDIGCADGAHMQVLYSRGITGIGIDVSIPNILRGMKTFPHLHFIHGFAEKIPFIDHYFDIALMGDILEHLRDPKSVIKEVFRVAKSLAVCVPIGEKTLEHISPYESIRSVISLFEDLNVKLTWHLHGGDEIAVENVHYADESPWVYLRVDSIPGIPLSKYALEIIDICPKSSESEDVRDEWSDRTASRDFQEVTRFYCTAELVEGPKVLEMACGNGDMSVVIAKKNVTVNGIDIKKKGIEWAKRTACAQKVSQKLTFEIRDAASSGFPDEEFNTVIIPELIEHIKDPHQIISEALRVVKTGGLILISVPDGPDPNPDHIRCFFRETLKLELSQYTDEITWHRLPFKRWLIVTFRKKLIHTHQNVISFDKVTAIKEFFKDAPINNLPLPGFNIIGPVGAGNEFGARIRAFIQMLLECGYPVSVKELLVDGQQGSLNPFRNLSYTGNELPYAINCFCLQPLMINQVFSSAPSWLRLVNRYNICFPDIASANIPEVLYDQFNRMDAVIALNTEIDKGIRKFNPSLEIIPTELFPYNHRKGYYQRINFGIPENDILFITFIDIKQSTFFQNVDPIVEAFKLLPTEKKHLVIILDTTTGVSNENYNSIKKIIQFDYRISLREGLIGREDTQSLFEIADVGINLTTSYVPSPWIMEMMANGKTVICIANPHLEPLINEKTALIVPIEHEDIATNARHIDRKILQSQMNCYLEDKELCKKIRAQASLTISMLHDKLCTGATADLVMTMTDKLLKKRAQVHKSKKGSVSKPLKILFLNRKDIFENPDTDTSVMEQTRINLEGRGHKVTVCAGYPDEVSQYDIVHGFNSAYSVYTDAFVERAVHEGIPFVVTALQDDFPRYMNKAIMTYRLFEKYIDMGQPDNFFDKQYEMVRKQDPAQFLTSPLALSHAAAVLVSGNEEAAVIKKYFPSARIKVGPVGHFFKKMTVDPQLFINKYKINDFVLCVSPFELKKNQLMLLKALENDNIPVVFVGEGGKYNISYIQLCKSFKRKAQTLFVDSLSEEMLSSAFAAAKVHCLPSWYELPGIVTVKAASYGCQVVQSSWGTINDYCRDRIITCEPDDYHSIRNAVLEALSKGRNKVEGQSINNINWERSTDFIVDTYKYALESGNNCDEPERASNDNASIQAMMDPGRLIEEVTKLVENSKFQDAVLLYETNRPHVVNIPELVKFDELMKKVKMHVKIHC